jgi:hypothetical protein
MGIETFMTGGVAPIVGNMDWSLQKGGDMKAAETLIAWNAIDHKRRRVRCAPAGSIAVGLLLRDMVTELLL